ncbi:hypothetical protein F4778DRAFT_727248 [Xylariomycetidae sp. FL2044]|nr:hypothetical protein F4778DRAFT_727248 [Xylariomycetidae sp. FL2044]
MALVQTSIIEYVPTEVVEGIMVSIDNDADLHAFISSSPILLKIFLAAKHRILYYRLINKLDCVLKDAMMEQSQPSLVPHSPVYFQDVEEAVERYKHILAGDIVEPSELGTTDIIDMMVFNRAIEFFVDWFQADVLNKRSPWNQANDENDPVAKKLSRTERLRITRALYRYQTITKIYGTRMERPDDIEASMEHYNVKLLDLFEPFEVHQIAAVDQYISDLLSYLIQLSSVGILPLDTFMWTDPWGNMVDQDTAFVGFFRYLQWSYHYAKDRLQNHEETKTQLPDMMNNYLEPTWSALWEIQDEEGERKDLEEYKTTKDTREEEAELQVFVGDHVDQVPYAWVKRYPHYVNRFGDFDEVDNAKKKLDNRERSHVDLLAVEKAYARWCCVFWDEERAEEILRRCRGYWKDGGDAYEVEEDLYDQ